MLVSQRHKNLFDSIVEAHVNKSKGSYARGHRPMEQAGGLPVEHVNTLCVVVGGAAAPGAAIDGEDGVRTCDGGLEGAAGGVLVVGVVGVMDESGRLQACG